MKKLLFAVPVIAMAVLASCSKVNPGSNAPSQEGFNISILGEMGEFAATKSTAESCIRLKWEAGDIVYAYGSNGSSIAALGELTVAVESDNSYVALMSGTLSAAPADGKLYLVHCPLLTSAPEISEGAISISLASQPSSCVPFVAYSTVTGVSATDQSGLKANFSFASSVIKANVYGIDDSTKMLSAVLCDVNTACKLTFGEAITVAGETAGVVTKTIGTSSSASGKADFYIAVPAISASSDRTLIVKTDDAWFAKNGAVTKAHEENSYVNTICDLTEATYAYETFGNGICIKGIIWAPVNCGYNATTAPAGLLYQWGKKQGFANTGSISTSSSQLASMAAGVGCTDFIACNNDCWYAGGNNVETWPTDKDYDPCPTGWRVSTNQELSDLATDGLYTNVGVEGQENETFSPINGDWTTTGGPSSDQTGYIFGKNNTNKVFFPITDSRGKTGSTYDPTWGYYWSSSHGYGTGDWQVSSAIICFGKDTLYPFYLYYRYYGNAVRCVKVEE